MKGNNGISSESSNINEDNVTIPNLSVTTENEQEREDNKIKNIALKVASVTPIIPSSYDHLMKEKLNNARVLYASYYRNDRYKILKSLLNLRCMFCGSCSPIKFDMELHLYENHRENLLKDLPIQKKNGFRMDNRIEYAINQMESEAHKCKRYFGIGGH